MKPIIGIITRPVFSDENNNMFGVYEEVSTAIGESGGIPVGILPLDSIEDTIFMCDGLIFQGGDQKEEYENKYLEYAYNHDIPVLGICLGMQTMGEMFNGYIEELSEHKEKEKKYVHEVIIKKDSKLYSFIKKEKIMVNSRHKSALIKTDLDVTAMTKDGIIEAVEDKTKKCFVGVQWHPESMIAYDTVAQNLFKSFVDICRK